MNHNQVARRTRDRLNFAANVRYLLQRMVNDQLLTPAERDRIGAELDKVVTEANGREANHVEAEPW